MEDYAGLKFMKVSGGSWGNQQGLFARTLLHVPLLSEIRTFLSSRCREGASHMRVL